MSAIKVIDINEEAKQEAPNRQNQLKKPKQKKLHEVVEEAPQHEVVNEVVESNTGTEPKEPFNTSSQAARLKVKLITCPKCNK